jgi:hypothetical protein
MDMRGPKVHSFIVKLWLDEPGDKTETRGWHGYITHVPSGKRRYLQSLYDILSFVKSNVGKINSDVAQPPRDRRWLNPWRRKKE